MDKILSPASQHTEEKYLKCLLKSLTKFNSNNFEKASRQLEKLLQLTSKPSKYEICSLNNLSFAYSKQKNFNKAYSFLEKALTKLKSQPPSKELLGTLINISSVCIYLNQFAESAAFALSAKQLISFEPKFLPIVNYNLSLAYMQTSKLQEAEKVIKQAIADLKDTSDPELASLIKSAYSSVKSRKSAGLEFKQIKSCKEIKTKKKVLRSTNLANEATPKEKKQENPPKSLKRCGSLIQDSCRNSNPARLVKEKQNSSNTSSTESIKNISRHIRTSLACSKTVKDLFSAEKLPKTPSKKKKRLIGNRIQSIEDHLATIEKKINHFAQQCKPLITLTEDPDEQLDSHRVTKAKPEIRNLRYDLSSRELAVIRIQRGWRRYRSRKRNEL